MYHKKTIMILFAIRSFIEESLQLCPTPFLFGLDRLPLPTLLFPLLQHRIPSGSILCVFLGLLVHHNSMHTTHWEKGRKRE